jgi:hypothetical protein
MIMKQAVLRYGIYASISILVLAAINLSIVAKTADYFTQEVTGYLTILLSMIFVFAGIRHFRNHVNGGSLTLWEGVKMGILIALIPAIFFGLFDVLYTEVLNPVWKEEYYNHYVQQLKESTPPEKLSGELQKLEEQKEMFGNPAMQFLIMSGTVFIIGAIVSIISSLTLRKNKPVTV